MKNEEPKVDSPDKPIVLGQQLADAHRADTKWRESSMGSQSPLPEAAYDFWRGDLSLLAPAANPLDAEIRRVCRLYASYDADARCKIRRSISMDQFYTLMNFAKRSAVFGIRASKPDSIADGLTAIAMIEQERVDFRDILCCLGFLYHAANRVGGNAQEMFRDAATKAEHEVAEFFLNFTKPTHNSQSLRKSWGYEEIKTETGVGFVGWGFNKYKPTLDLQATIIDISKLVASDSYQPSEIEVATELPEVWLEAKQSPAGKHALSAIRACAMVSASLRPDKHVEHDSQQFTVFLVEAANESDAQALIKLAESNESPTIVNSHYLNRGCSA